MWLPTNDDTKTILYDTKFIKSSKGRYPPLIWKVSKIEDTAIDGISKFTMTQEMFNPSTDNAELGIADYWESAVEPELLETEETPTISDLEITYSGKPAVRAGGGYKKFVLKTRVNGELIDVANDIIWDVNFENGKIEQLEIIKTGNILKVKCLSDYTLIGQTFNITATHKHSSKSMLVEVIGL